MKNIYKLYIFFLSITVLAGPLGGENGTAFEEDTFELSSFDTTQSYLAKASALGAYGEVAIDRPEILIGSPHLASWCTIGDTGAENYSLQSGLCRSLRNVQMSGASDNWGGMFEPDNSMFYLGSVDPFNKSAADIADLLNANEEAPIDCAVLKNEAGETDSFGLSQSVADAAGISSVSVLDTASAPGGSVEQGFDCRIAKDASGNVRIRLRALTGIRIIARNLPPVDLNVSNGDLNYGSGGSVAPGVHSVKDIRLVALNYDPATDGDGVSSGKLLSSVSVGSTLDTGVNDVVDALMLIDFEYDLEDLKLSANGALSGAGGEPALTSDYALGEVELSYTFQTI